MEKLFGTDGIRGMAGVWPLTPDFVLKIGQGFGVILRSSVDAPSVVIGRDTRDSGPALQCALAAGLSASGVDVLDVGIITTPGVAVLTRHLNASAGVVISASHNPVEQNGLKFFDGIGQKLPSHMEQEVEKILSAGDSGWDLMTAVPRKRLGRLTNCIALHEIYIRELLSEHPDSFLEGVRMVMDCGNGAASRLAPEVFSRAGADIRVVNGSPNGTNINVLAGSEHVRRAPREMGVLVHQSKAAFGLAFDGDADRVVFVDDRGNVVDGDHMLGLFAQCLQKDKRLLANTVVTTTMRNTGLKNYIEATGMKMEETPVGDRFVIERLVELKNQFPGDRLIGLGGEQAGHLILLDDEHFTGDGMRTALHLARFFLESGTNSLADFANGVGKTPQIIASASAVDLPRISREKLAALEESILGETPGLIRANLRYSGTEPLFRVMLESDSTRSEVDLAEIAVRLCRKVQSKREIEGTVIDILNCTSGGELTPPS